MPTSQWWQIPKIIDLLKFVDPKSILDVGPGFGKYGFLAREYLEVWEAKKGYCKFERRIDCVEAYERYITPLHKFIYDNIYIGDALELIGKIAYTYDLLLLIDVLEHFDKESGAKFLKKIAKKSKFFIISTPKQFIEVKSVFGNQYEIHRSKWSSKELEQQSKELGMDFIYLHESHSLIYLFGERDKIRDIKRRIRKTKVKGLAAKIPLVSWVYRFIRP